MQTFSYQSRITLSLISLVAVAIFLISCTGTETTPPPTIIVVTAVPVEQPVVEKPVDEPVEKEAEDEDPTTAAEPNAGQNGTTVVVNNIPPQPPANPVQSCGTYTVRAGDNLYRIGQAHGFTSEALAQANGIQDASKISVGQVLIIPCGGVQPPQQPEPPHVDPPHVDPPPEDPPGTDPNSDDDQDGLTNQEERDLGTNPYSSDSDNDGLTDGQEVLDFGTNPHAWDSDSDDVSDSEELFAFGTDANAWDSDYDELGDGEEIFLYGTDANDYDTDGDGLWDSEELFSLGTDPLYFDTDGDGYDDYTEVYNGTNPLDATDPAPAVEVNGWTTFEVFYSGGSFYQSGLQWIESNGNGTNYFTEVGRDEWSVYLQDINRDGVSIQLDLWTKIIYYDGPETAGQVFLYNITDAR